MSIFGSKRNIRVLMSKPGYIHIYYPDKLGETKVMIGYVVEIDSKIKDEFTFEMTKDEFKKYSTYLYHESPYNSNIMPFDTGREFYERYLPEVLL